MNLVFESITLKRFRSFLEETTLHFDSAGIGLYFLKGQNHVQKALGSNGSGKSSILDALLWCLYGKTVQGLKNPDILPWVGKGTTEVSVTLLVEKNSHTIKRTSNPNLLTIDGKEAAQEYVEKLVNVPLEVIPYTLIMGQRQPLFFDLTPSEKLKIFSEPLNLERWEVRSQHAAQLVQGLEIEISGSEREREILEAQVEEIEKDIESAKAKKELWEKQRESVLNDKGKKISEIEKELEPLAVARDDADLKLDRAETELRAIRPNLKKLTDEKQKVEREQDKASREHNALAVKQTEIVNQLEAIEEEGLCPLCKQPLKSHKKALQADLESEANGIVEKLKTPARAFKQASEALAKLETACIAEEESWKMFESHADEARDTLDYVKPKIAELETEIAGCKELIASYENQDNPYKEQFATFRKRKSAVEQQIEAATKRIETKNEYVERVRPWIKWFKEIKLYTLEEILQELEITTNGMMEEFGLVGWNVKYDVERETKSKTIARGLNIAVHSPSNTKIVKWESFSGGEAQRLRIIGSLALGSVLLNHLGVQVNLAVFDEPTESLSKEGVADLVELLSNYAKDTKKHIWLIDHHTIESSRFVDVITVHKDKHGSSLA